MRLRPRTLTVRLIATAVALVAVVSIFVAISSTLVVSSYLTHQLDRRVSEALDRATGANGPVIDPDHDPFPGEPLPQGKAPYDVALQNCQPIVPRTQGSGSITAVVTADCRTALEVSSQGALTQLPSSQVTSLAAVPADMQTHGVTIGSNHYRAKAATLNLDGTAVKVIQATPTTETDKIITLMSWGEAALTLTGVALAVLLGTAVVRRQMRPLRKVAATATAVTHTQLSSGEVEKIARVPAELVDSYSEIGQVGEALNQMIDHVEAALGERQHSEEQLRAFLADASHELRTPLATIKGYAELTRRTGADAGETMTKVESEANRMSALVEDMLLLARLDAGRALESKPVEISQLVIEAMNDARVVDPARRWRLEVPDERVVVSGDELRIHQAVTNLINNASRHTPEGTTVTATVLTDPIRVQIHDDGPGIAPELQASIFDRFTRGDSSRTRASGGVGLGMSLVKAIMAAHGGTASVRSTPGDTTFELSF